MRKTTWSQLVVGAALGACAACGGAVDDERGDGGDTGGRGTGDSAVESGSTGGTGIADGSDVTVIGGTGGGGAGGIGPGTDAGGVMTEAGGGAISTYCGDVPCDCSNGADDDGDGAIDGMDAECTNPEDGDESSFATNIEGMADPNWSDCFFDDNVGSGDDSCRYHIGCLESTLPMSDPDCQLRPTCVEFCEPRTPNGCDCFGCCSVLTSGGTVDIFLSGTCGLQAIQDEQVCPRCVKTDTCANSCGPCELCLGKQTLPPECVNSAGNAMHTCDGGEQVCDTDIPCPANYYCHLGCCLPAS